MNMNRKYEGVLKKRGHMLYVVYGGAYGPAAGARFIAAGVYRIAVRDVHLFRH